MNKKHAIFAAAFGVLLAGCSDVEVANVETSSQNVIGFNVIGSTAETKATPINSSNLKSEDFSVFCYTTKGVPFLGSVDAEYNHNGVRISWNGKKWYYSNPKEVHYWPVDDVLNFYAIYPGTTIKQSDKHYMWEFKSDFQGVHYKCLDEFNTDLPDDIQLKHKNHDVMYGIAKDQVYSTHNGVVTFHFKHILSQIVFKAKKNLESLTVTIKDIKLHNIKQGGTFAYPEDVQYTTAEMETSRDCWSNVAESDTYSPYIIKDGNIEVGTENTDITVSGDSPSLLIPQTVTAWTVSSENKKTIEEADAAEESYLEVTCVLQQNGQNLTTVDADGYATIYVPFSADWMPGKRYVYTLIFGGGYDADGNAILDPITFDAAVEEWGDEIHDINY